MTPRTQAAFTLVELIVCVVVVGFLISLTLPRMSCRPLKGTMTQSLSNMRQLYLATQQMELDRDASGNTNLGWPGNTGGSFSNWATTLVASNYLSTNDLCKLLSGPGKIVPPGRIPTANNTAVLVYAVSTESPGDAVFLTSANFTNTSTGGEPLDSAAKPYGNKGFVVFRKAGDGSIFLSKQTGQTNIIGSFVPLCR